jgi:hypothetical protein
MIHIVTTIGDLQGRHREPTERALRHNLTLPEVARITVLSEAGTEWLSELDAGMRLSVVRVSTRPTFAEMIAQANAELSVGARAVCICNSDISLGSQADAISISDVLSWLDAGHTTPAVLALTRHEFETGAPVMSLYDGDNGLPNTISADLWAFARPLTVTRDLFYSPGQMNCDTMLAHDLISTGHRLFNPCLDVRILHHEGGENIAIHTEETPAQPGNYYGVPWVSSSWLRLGYRPKPHSVTGRRLIVSVPEAAETRLGGVIDDLARLSDRYGLEVQILTEGDPDALVRRHAAALAAAPRLWLARPAHGIIPLRQAFLRGAQYSFQRIAFVSDPARIDDALMKASDSVFVTLRPHAVSQVPARFGCTLITSVYRSDSFISGFLANSRALNGYGRMIEHVFLLSALSELEVAVFDDLLERQDNAVILWHRQDPGLYECWNIGIRVARTDYVSNANVDDLRDSDHVLALIQDLESNPDCDVAATALNPFTEMVDVGLLPIERAGWYAHRAGRFGFFDIAHLADATPPELVPYNMPHCMPVWRRALHNRFGWFDEARYGTYADWAFWLKVLRSGRQGWMNGRPLGFYFVNPASHNRRGSELKRFHKRVEDDFMETFLARREKRMISLRTVAPPLQRKLVLGGKSQSFGQHRNSFNSLIHSLEPLEISNADGDGVLFIPFLERQFVWGDEWGEANSSDPRALEQPWIGILHVPFEVPEWISDIRPERFLTSDLFLRSRPYCRGIVTLAHDIEEDLQHFDPGLSTLSVLHPTESAVRSFDPKRYLAAPTIIQVGDWLRKLQAIHRVQARGHRRIMLLKQGTRDFLERDIRMYGNHQDPLVEMVDFISNDRYDELLSSSVVLCLLYATAANNVVIECIARATPILINPLPAVVEYLGRDYGLYVLDEAEADAKLATPGAVETAHEYLLARRAQLDLSYEGFCRTIGASGFYENL